MRDRITIEFTGFEDFENQVKQFRHDTVQAIKKRTAQAGRNIQREARRTVPVDHGLLKNSIRVYHFDLTTEVTVEQMYAPFVEFGTGSLVDVPEEMTEVALTFKRGPGRNTRPRPFLYPAFFKEREQYLKDLNEIVKAD